MRTVYACYKCEPPSRTFTRMGLAVPKCAVHGEMSLQPNMPYFGTIPPGSDIKELAEARNRLKSLLKPARR